MKRGKAYIEAGRQRIHKNNRFDMSFGEMEMFVEMMHHDSISAIIDAYYFGVEAGNRMAKKRRR